MPGVLLELNVGTIIGGVITQLTGILESVIPAALGLAAVVFGVAFGWNLLRRFVS